MIKNMPAIYVPINILVNMFLDNIVFQVILNITVALTVSKPFPWMIFKDSNSICSNMNIMVLWNVSNVDFHAMKEERLFVIQKTAQTFMTIDVLSAMKFWKLLTSTNYMYFKDIMVKWCTNVKYVMNCLMFLMIWKNIEELFIIKHVVEKNLTEAYTKNQYLGNKHANTVRFLYFPNYFKLFIIYVIKYILIKFSFFCRWGYHQKFSRTL